MPKRAISDQQIEDCFEVLAELRPISNAASFWQGSGQWRARAISLLILVTLKGS